MTKILRIKGCEALIKDKDIGILQQCSCNIEAAALTMRKLPPAFSDHLFKSGGHSGRGAFGVRPSSPMARQYDEAIKQFKKTLEIDPNHGFAHYGLGGAYVQKGMYDEAITELQKSMDISGQAEIAGVIGYAYAMAGKKDEARKRQNELLKLSERKDVIIDPMMVVYTYVGLGEKDQAFEWLNKSIEYRSIGITFLKVEPAFDPLRSDPRFIDLLRRVKLVL